MIENGGLFLLLVVLSPFIIFGVVVVIALAITAVIDAVAKLFGRDPFSR